MSAPYPRFNRQQELELFRRYRSGDAEAGNLLAVSVMPLVYKLLRRAALKHRKNSDDGEVESVAHFVIARALSKFNEEAGYRFTTYAGNAATKSGAQMLWEQGTLTHVPRALMQDPSRLTESEKKLRAQAMATNKGVCSLDVSVVPGSKAAMRDFIADTSESFDSQLADREEREQMLAAYQKSLDCIGQKDPRAAEILRQRLEHERTLEDIGNDYGISKERVRQIQSKFYPELVEGAHRHYMARRHLEGRRENAQCVQG